jgi:hypothetical protein
VDAGPRGARLLTPFVGGSASLRHLILHNCDVDDDGGWSIVSALCRESPCKLQTLDLSGNPVRNRTAESLAVLLVGDARCCHAMPCACVPA